MDNIKNMYRNNLTLINNILGSYLIKGLALLISFFTLPAYILYFNDNNVLGIWFTLLSIIQWILIFDLGLGNGLRNKIVPFIIAKDYQSIKKYISSSYFILGIISIIASLIGLPLIFLLDWNNILNISSDIISNSILRITIFVSFLGVVIQFFLKTIISVLHAMKKVALSNFLVLLSSIFTLTYVLLFNTNDISTNLVNLAYVQLFTMNIPLFIATIIIFTYKLKLSKPSFRHVDKKICKDVVKLGGYFFYIQITLLVINLTNEFFITWLYGPSHVVEYLVYYRLFYLSVTFFSLLSNPLWSEVSELYFKRQIERIKLIYRKLIVIIIMSIIGNLFILIFLQLIIDLWLGENSISVNYYYGILFVAFSTVTIFNMSLSIFANAINELKTQIVIFSIGMIVKIPIILLLNINSNSWINVLIATIIILLPYSFIQPRYIIRQFSDLTTD